MNIVCIGAHQDDEMSCLGTLIKYAQRGDRITIVSVSNGDKGGQYDPSVPHAEIAQQRIHEATMVAEALGGSYHCIGQEDEYIEDNRAVRDAVTAILRTAKADVVITCPLNDYNPDHYITGEITYHAVMLSTVQTIDLGVAPLENTPAMYYYDTTAGVGFDPELYVDISDVFERKCELLRLHESQMINMETFGGWDLVTYSEIVGRFRGLQCGVSYAEAFRTEQRWPRARAQVLLP